MSKRVSRSLLDPFFLPMVKPLYRALPIPRAFPPEGIIAVGHVLAIAGAYGFAKSPALAWGGWLAVIGVLGNHVADMLDGTHARATGQCRNGGELLDHFTDPLSFSYWMVGLGVACGRLDLALVAVISIYAAAVLTNIRAKITGEFRLHPLGPTEFKALLIGCGAALAVANHLGTDPFGVAQVAKWMLLILGVALALQTVVSLISAVRAVNRDQAPPDSSEWIVDGADAGPETDRETGPGAL